MVGIKDFITQKNVVKTYQQGKYLCFVLKNGMTIKLDPNVRERDEGENKKENKQ